MSVEFDLQSTGSRAMELDEGLIHELEHTDPDTVRLLCLPNGRRLALIDVTVYRRLLQTALESRRG